MIRTIKGAVEELRKSDPETPVSEGMLRRWIIAGELPSRKSGNKYLIDMDVLNNFLKGQL